MGSKEPHPVSREVRLSGLHPGPAPASCVGLQEAGLFSQVDLMSSHLRGLSLALLGPPPSSALQIVGALELRWRERSRVVMQG